MNTQNELDSKSVQDLTPDAVEAEKARKQTNGLGYERTTRARGVDWVRPTDLMARHSAAVAGRGIDFQAQLSRRTRTGIATATRSLSVRARRLPPLSVFGRRGATREPVTRGAVGKS